MYLLTRIYVGIKQIREVFIGEDYSDYTNGEMIKLGGLDLRLGFVSKLD